MNTSVIHSRSLQNACQRSNRLVSKSTLCRPGCHVLLCKPSRKPSSVVRAGFGLEDLAANSQLSLIVSSASMCAASYYGGILPAHFRCSKNDMLKVSGLGAGLLVGTALSIILPEGFNQFHRLQEEASFPFWVPNVVLLLGFVVMLLFDVVTGSSSDATGGCCVPTLEDTTPRRTETSERAPASIDGQMDLAMLASSQSMLSSNQTKGQGRAVAIALPAVEAVVPRTEDSAGMQVLVGLCAHSVADGLAVGAASMSSSLAVSVGVLLAMVMHKAPMGFGLGSYLVAQAGWDREQVHQGLLAFSVASPLAAAATYLLINSLPESASEGGVPLALLFSGGTFMYAASVHILPSFLRQAQKADRGTALTSVAAAVLGCLVPLAISIMLPHSCCDPGHQHSSW